MTIFSNACAPLSASHPDLFTAEEVAALCKEGTESPEIIGFIKGVRPLVNARTAVVYFEALKSSIANDLPDVVAALREAGVTFEALAFHLDQGPIPTTLMLAIYEEAIGVALAELERPGVCLWDGFIGPSMPGVERNPIQVGFLLDRWSVLRAMVNRERHINGKLDRLGLTEDEGIHVELMAEIPDWLEGTDEVLDFIEKRYFRRQVVSGCFERWAPKPSFVLQN